MMTDYQWTRYLTAKIDRLRAVSEVRKELHQRKLRQEHNEARSQMADELRAQFSHCEYISRMALMLAIEKAERAERAERAE